MSASNNMLAQQLRLELRAVQADRGRRAAESADRVLAEVEVLAGIVDGRVPLPNRSEIRVRITELQMRASELLERI